MTGFLSQAHQKRNEAAARIYEAVRPSHEPTVLPLPSRRDPASLPTREVSAARMRRILKRIGSSCSIVGRGREPGTDVFVYSNGSHSVLLEVRARNDDDFVFAPTTFLVGCDARGQRIRPYRPHADSGAIPQCRITMILQCVR